MSWCKTLAVNSRCSKQVFMHGILQRYLLQPNNIQMDPLVTADESLGSSHCYNSHLVHTPMSSTTSPIEVPAQSSSKKAYNNVYEAIHSTSCPATFSVYDILHLSRCMLTKKEANAALYLMVRQEVLCMTTFDGYTRGRPWFWLSEAHRQKLATGNTFSEVAQEASSMEFDALRQPSLIWQQ